MSLAVLDGTGTSVNLKTSVSGSDLVPHHNVDAVAGTVAATQSGPWSISLTGSMLTPIVPGTAASNLGKAEDAAHSSGDVGVMALAVRTDTAALRAGTDGDYSPLLTDSTGRLHTNAVRHEDVGVVGSVLTPLRAFAAPVAGTDSAIVAAVASKKIRVLALVLSSAGAATITLKSKPAGAGAAISATFAIVAGTTVVLPHDAAGWAETVSGEGLSADVVTSTVQVQVIYVLV